MKIVTLCTGNKYPFTYVEKLYRGLQRNLTKPFEFQIITESKYPGWWGKIEIFNPAERIVFLDLDTVIVGNCDFLFEYQGPFAILRDFYRPNGYGSAVMSIEAGYGKHVVESFEANSKSIMEKFHGDQNWIEQQVSDAVLWQDIYPGKIKSFKADNLESGPKGASIVCFHGIPRPYDVAHLPWMIEHWR